MDIIIKTFKKIKITIYTGNGIAIKTLKKNKAERQASNFNSYHKAVISKLTLYRHQNRPVAKGNRTESLKTNECFYDQLFYHQLCFIMWIKYWEFVFQFCVVEKPNSLRAVVKLLTGLQALKKILSIITSNFQI